MKKSLNLYFPNCKKTQSFFKKRGKNTMISTFSTDEDEANHHKQRVHNLLTKNPEISTKSCMHIALFYENQEIRKWVLLLLQRKRVLLLEMETEE